MTSQFFLRLSLTTLLLIAGCAGLETQDPGSPRTGEAAVSNIGTRFANVPIPPGFDLDRSKSFIYESGSGNVKVGKLYLKGWNSAEEVIEFFRNEMVAKGWTSISIMEQNTTVMMYEQETQVCTIMVEPSLGKTHVQINVGPK
jgi:hypothetical protein